MTELLREFWQVSAEMAPYLLLGFAVAGLLWVWLPKGFVLKHLGHRGFLSVLKASLLGIPLPLCSCGVIPVAAGLRKQGASKGATASFLLSTPQTGVDSLLVTFAMLGPLYTIYRPIAALVSGLVGGLLIDRAGQDEDWQVDGESSREPSRGGGFISSLREAVDYGFGSLPAGIGKPLIAGLVIAAVISWLVPDDYFAQSMLGNTALGYLAMLGIGIPLYVCSTGSVPIAASLIVAGISPGAALVFLISGPATNAAAITTVWKVLGRNSALLYLSTVAVTAVVSGAVLDLLFNQVGTAGMEAHLHHSGAGWFGTLSAIVLFAVVLNALRPRGTRAIQSTGKGNNMDTLELRVSGMT